MMSKVRINNAVRTVIATAMSQLTLLSPDRSARLVAAQQITESEAPILAGGEA